MSSCVADVFGRHKLGMTIGDPPRRISMSGVTAHTLCRNHNNLLSSLDREAGRFFAAFADFFSPQTSESDAGTDAQDIVVKVDGGLLERWALKTFLNHAIFTGAVNTQSNLWHSRGANIVEQVFASKALPGDQGLYNLPPSRPAKRRFAGYFNAHCVIALNCSLHDGHTHRLKATFDAPMWYYISVFHQELALRGNISVFGDKEWNTAMSRTDDDPAVGGIPKPKRLGTAKTVRDRGTERSQKLWVHLHWPEPRVGDA